MYTFQQENADFARILQGCKPYAAAYVKGSAAYPLIGGRILFYPAGDRGVLVVSNVRGLPVDDTACGARFFGIHIHEKGDRRPSDGEAFSDAGTHYNPSDCMHPAHWKKPAGRGNRRNRKYPRSSNLSPVTARKRVPGGNCSNIFAARFPNAPETA